MKRWIDVCIFEKGFEWIQFDVIADDLEEQYLTIIHFEWANKCRKKNFFQCIIRYSFEWTPCPKKKRQKKNHEENSTVCLAIYEDNTVHGLKQTRDDERQIKEQKRNEKNININNKRDSIKRLSPGAWNRQWAWMKWLWMK